WITTYAQNDLCKKYKNFDRYFKKYYTNYDLMYIDSVEKTNNYRKVFTHIKQFIKLNKFSLMTYNPNGSREYDLMFCASDSHPSKNWDVFYSFLSFCEENRKTLSVLIVTPVIADKNLSKYTQMHYIKTTVKRGLTSEEM